MKTTVTVKPYTSLFEMWKKVLKTSRVTVGKSDLEKEPSERFKKSILKSQHSPIRKLKFEIEFTNMK